MKTLTTSILVLVMILILLIIASSYLGTPILQICDSDCKYSREQEAKAADGDIQAVRFLYAKSLKSGSKSEAESLAMEGGFLGDSELQKAYLTYWNSYPIARKTSLMKIFKARSESSRTEYCFFKMVEGAQYLQACE